MKTAELKNMKHYKQEKKLEFYAKLGLSELILMHLFSMSAGRRKWRQLQNLVQLCVWIAAEKGAECIGNKKNNLWYYVSLR